VFIIPLLIVSQNVRAYSFVLWVLCNKLIKLTHWRRRVAYVSLSLRPSECFTFEILSKFRWSLVSDFYSKSLCDELYCDSYRSYIYIHIYFLLYMMIELNLISTTHKRSLVRKIGMCHKIYTPLQLEILIWNMCAYLFVSPTYRRDDNIKMNHKILFGGVNYIHGSQHGVQWGALWTR